MEPMLLGSPVSPISSGLMQSGGGVTTPSTTSAPFLPSYLLGDTQHSSSSRVSLPGSSPGSSRHPFVGLSSGQTSPSSPHSAKEIMPPNFHTPRFGRGLVGVERPSGPPVHGLGVSPGGPHTPSLQQRLHSPFPDHLQRQGRTPLGSPHTPLRPLPATPHGARDGTHNSSIISYEVHGEAAANTALSDEWVTVFGFPVASASHILSQFALLGTVADQRLPGAGNWMHLKYQTPLQARKALALNGKVFSGNIMIGVVPCTDKAVLLSSADAANKENQRLAAANTSSYGGLSCSVASGTSFNCGPADATTSSPFSTPKANIRSLAQTYPTTPSDNQVLPAINTPKKNDSLLSKAMQHILGV